MRTVERLLERANGIEPSALAWEARVLPLYDARSGRFGTATRPCSVTVDPHNRPSGCTRYSYNSLQAGVSGYCQLAQTYIKFLGRFGASRPPWAVIAGDFTVELCPVSMVWPIAGPIPRITATDGESGDNRTGVICALSLSIHFLGSKGATGCCLSRRFDLSWSATFLADKTVHVEKNE